jgi:hypothetical protein
LWFNGVVDRFESLANWVSDQNWGWWPFLALRPPRHKRMDSWMVAKLCLFFSPLYWLVLLVGLGWATHSWPFGLTLPQLSAASLGLFLFYRLTFAVCWNRRALRIATVRALRPGAE